MELDFSNVPDVEDYSPLPDGKYYCRLKEVEEAQTRGGDDMWKLKFAVVNGEFEGRKIFDNMVFSDAALKRVKLVLSRLGVDVSGKIDLTPELIVGRAVYVEVVTEEYENDEGQPKKRNSVLFAGYESAEGETAAAATGVTGAEDDGEEKLPF